MILARKWTKRLKNMQPPELIPLLLYMEGCATEQEMNANVSATIERGYTPINGYLDQFRGEVSICGAGPSIKETCKQIRGDILAINSAIGFLLGQGITPKFGMIWDAAEICENFAIPHPDTTYLVGARCHPKVFERLKGCKIIVWHAGGDHNIAEFLAARHIDEPMVNGGSAGVTRAMYLSVALGYRKLNIYGADSSYSDSGETHVTGSLVQEKDFHIWINNDENAKRFRTTPEWCAQIEEYKIIYSQFSAWGIDVEVYGDGMLQHMHSILKRRRELGITHQSQPLEETTNASV